MKLVIRLTHLKSGHEHVVEADNVDKVYKKFNKDTLASIVEDLIDDVHINGIGQLKLGKFQMVFTKELLNNNLLQMLIV